MCHDVGSLRCTVVARTPSLSPAPGCDVTVFDLRSTTFDEPSVKMVQGDLTKLDQVTAAFKGAEVVFHVASPDPLSRNKAVFELVNINGTRNVVDACLANGVPRLIFTSSASVIYDGSNQSGVDETLPYPATFRDDYCRTKAEAERIIMEAGPASGGKLVTVSVRPHGIFGPRDPALVPRLTANAKAGRTKVAIGSTDNIVDFTYVGNVVHGHMRAAEAAVKGSPANGKTYFITNDDPLPFWEFMSRVCLGLGYQAPTMRLPYGFMLAVSYIVDGILASLNAVLGTKLAITFTPSVVQIAGTHHWYSCEAAKRDLKYEPVWDMHSALLVTLRSFQHLAAPGAKPLPEFKAFTAAEVAEHNSLQDLWVIIDGDVYDLTEYVDQHPGKDAIGNNAGGDASEGFHGEQHPAHVVDTVRRFKIGSLVKE